MSDKTLKQTFFSISLATTITVTITNPLDLIKVRLQTDSKDCSHKAQGACIYHENNQKQLSNFRNSSIFKLWKVRNLKQAYHVLCDCLPTKSTISALMYVIKTEGVWALMKGFKQSLTGALISSTFFFSCYEMIRKEIKQHTSNEILIPLYTSVIARTITTCLTFPFEYLRTVQQSQKAENTNFKKSYGAGFAALYQREIVFSCVYWVLVENIRAKVRRNISEDILLTNLIAGATSGGIASAVTLPLDVAKTRKQITPEKYQSKSSFKVIQEIYATEGTAGILAGFRQRVIRTMIATSTVLTLYEFFSHQMMKHQLLG